MEKLKGIVESSIQPNATDVAWLKGNTLKHFSNGKWTAVGTPIVDSVDKLDENAENGSLATVSNIKTEEIEVEDKFSVRDIYVEENPDCEPLMELRLKVPETWPTEELVLFFGQKGYNSFEEVVIGNYLVLILTPEGVDVETYRNGELDTSDQILTDSVNEELLNEVNDIISSWDGMVFYGTLPIEGEPSFIPLTDSQTDYVDSIIGYDEGTHIETIETHTNDIYFKETTGWRKINDVKIVDSVAKLDKNAPRGSLATVVVNTIAEVPFSELYQPTSDEVNMETGVIDTTNLSSVSGIAINSSFDISNEIQNFEVYFFSKDVDLQGGVGQVVVLVLGAAMTMNFSTQEQNEFELFIPNEDGTIAVNEENLAIINNLLSSTEFVYRGAEDPSIADIFYKAISGVQKTDLYIKDVESWKLYKDTLSIPPQIEVVNSLNIGGNDKALSAEMGKLLAGAVGVIVDSEEELPLTSPVGARASVNISRVVGEKSLNVDKIHEENTFLHRVVVRSSVSYTPAVTVFTMELEAEDGTRLIIKIGPPYNYSSSRWGALVWGFSDNMPNSSSNRSQTLCEYASLTVGFTVLDVNTETLSNLNNELSSKNYRVVSGYSIGSYGVAVPNVFLYTYAAEVQKFTELYVRNEAGWEPYEALKNQSVTTEKISAEAVTTEKVADGAITLDKLSEDISTVIESCPISVESVDGLPSDAPLGLMASVLEVTTEEKSLDVEHESLSGERVVRVEINNTVYLSITNNFEFILTTKDGSSVEILSKGSGPDTQLYFIGLDGSEMALADYSRQYNTAELNSANIELLNELLLSDKYYSKDNYTNSEQSAIYAFFKGITVEKENINTKLYVKNTAGWEPYEALKDQSVTTEKVADGSITMDKLSPELQELLNSLKTT